MNVCAEIYGQDMSMTKIYHHKLDLNDRCSNVMSLTGFWITHFEASASFCLLVSQVTTSGQLAFSVRPHTSLETNWRLIGNQRSNRPVDEWLLAVARRIW